MVRFRRPGRGGRRGPGEPRQRLPWRTAHAPFIDPVSSTPGPVQGDGGTACLNCEAPSAGPSSRRSDTRCSSAARQSWGSSPLHHTRLRRTAAGRRPRGTDRTRSTPTCLGHALGAPMNTRGYGSAPGDALRPNLPSRPPPSTPGPAVPASDLQSAGRIRCFRSRRRNVS